MPVSSEEICHQLSDGVILCQLINRLYPQTILSIHLPDTNMVFFKFQIIEYLHFFLIVHLNLPKSMNQIVFQLNIEQRSL